MNTGKYKEKLENLKREYENLIKALDDGLESPHGDEISELSLYDNHPGDIASEVFEREKDVGQKKYLQEQIEKVEDALNKIESGKYGFCDKCGKPIPAERLEAIPLTTMCVDCRREEWEKGFQYNLKARRPVEEQTIMPPFGRRKDVSNQTVFDGEDSWQSVAKYGTSESPSDIGNVLDYDNIYYDFDEDLGTVERYEQIPVYKDKDGQFYQDFDGEDDEEKPSETHNNE